MTEPHPIFVEIRQQLFHSHSHEPWSSEQWWQAFVYVFYYGPRHGTEVDDLLFLVIDSRLKSVGEKTPYMVIRRDGDLLPVEFHIEGDRFKDINWKQSLELNLVLQGSYQLTVAVCDTEEVPYVTEPDYPLNKNTVVVSKRVHASTFSAGVNISFKKSDEGTICYPDICFAVEDFEKAFNSLILAEAQQRFCVVLTLLKLPESGGQIQVGPRIFGGYVSFQQVKKELLDRQNWFRRISAEQLITMKGPEDKGTAEVSTSVDAQSSAAQTSGSDAEDEDRIKNHPLRFLKRGAVSARDLFRKIQGENSSKEVALNSTSKLKFRCSLMTLTLPVDLVVEKILESNI